jgi:TetR/AcrR family transcriptional regulator, transcriptional repressor for nem operon
MAWNPQHKQQGREKILNAAARLFASQGFENTGINDIMAAAGMTRGAFYSHFNSKSELYQQALVNAALQRFRSALTDPADQDSALDFEHLVNVYLNPAHPEGRQGGCPMAFLVTDIAQRDDEVRSTYTQLFKGMLRRIQEATGNERPESLQQIVLMVGGVAIARAINDGNLRQELLEACKKGLLDT